MVMLISAVLLSIVFIFINGGLALVSLSEWTAHSEAVGIAPIIHT